MPNSQQSENEQQESFTGHKNVCESARFPCDFAHLTQPKIQNHHLKTKTIFFLIFDFITFRLFNQTVTKFCLYKYKATKYFRHKLELLLQKFRVIGYQGIRMKKKVFFQKGTSDGKFSVRVSFSRSLKFLKI